MNRKPVTAYAALEHSNRTIVEQAQKLWELSIRDPLTGRHNRRFFEEEVSVLYTNAYRYRQTFALVVGDIDHSNRVLNHKLCQRERSYRDSQPVRELPPDKART